MSHKEILLQKIESIEQETIETTAILSQFKRRIETILVILELVAENFKERGLKESLKQDIAEFRAFTKRVEEGVKEINNKV